MLYLALLVAASGLGGSFAPGSAAGPLLWSPESVARAEPVTPLQAAVVRAALSLLGAPYHYAAAGPGTCPTGAHPTCCDCSGLVGFAYVAAGVRLPRSSAEIAAAGQAVEREGALPGDILIFRSDGQADAQVNHSGIYVGNGLFVHAGTRGTRLDDLDGAYWRAAGRLRSIRRVRPLGPAGDPGTPVVPGLRDPGP